MPVLKWRIAMRCLMGAALMTLVGPVFAADPQPKQREATVRVSDEARRLHDACFLFDGHNDLPWQYRDRSRSKCRTKGSAPHNLDSRRHPESL